MSFQILNTKVVFNAQKTDNLGNVKGDLTFDRVDINIGDGFDGSSGIFKVPITGIYKMSFSGQSAHNRNIDYTNIAFTRMHSVVACVSRYQRIKY